MEELNSKPISNISDPSNELLNKININVNANITQELKKSIISEEV